MTNKPRIIGGNCEFCGVPAYKCIHHKGMVDVEGHLLPMGARQTYTVESKTVIQDGLHPSETKKYDMSNKKIADIIIPHHNRHTDLRNLLNCIDISLFNIIIVSGNSFGINCNKGAKIAETDKLIFLNDDTLPTNEDLIKLDNSLDNYDMIGTSQIAGVDNKQKYWGIGLYNQGGQIKHSIALEAEESIMVSGFCFGVKKEVWKKLKGFNEKFKTGNEDVDFGLRALEYDYKFGMLDLEIEHLESQSSGRMDNVNENEDLFYSIWTQDKLKTIKEKYA